MRYMLQLAGSRRIVPNLARLILEVVLYSCLLLNGCEILDTGAAAPEGGLRGRLYSERCSGVVMVSLFGHVDDAERTVEELGVGGASALAALRSRFGDLTRDSGRLSSRERCEDFSG
jgi:hypothetical protein